jgi:acetyl esterase/lipase
MNTLPRRSFLRALPPSVLALAAAGFVCAAPAAAAEKKAAKADLPAPTGKVVYKEVGDAKLELWIWKPAGWKPTDRRAGIVFYHGGGWRGGNPSAFSRQSAALAARGMVAISVQYRLVSRPGVTVADCVRDARSAFRWVRARAGELGLDPDKIAAGGGSAGGHLAAALVTLDHLDAPDDDRKISTRPAALVLFNPALKLGGLRDATDARFPDAASVRAIDPFEHLKPGHPPTLILHGEADTTVPIATVRSYTDKARELGIDCEVVGYPDQVHAFFNREPQVWETLRRAETFLARVGLLAPAR